MSTTRRTVSPEILDLAPPHDVEAEKGVLGSLILDPTTCNAIGVTLQVEDFYLEAHQTLYSHLLAMHDTRDPFDAVTIRARLQASGDFEAIGGTAGLAEIMQSVPYAANAAHYAKIVRDKATLRRLRLVGETLIRDVHDPAATPDELIVRADAAINQAAGVSGKITTSATEAITRAMDHIDALEGRGRGLPTGLADFDKWHGGLFGGELVILAARPRMGKTSLAVQIALHSAQRDRRVLFVSLEMSAAELMSRAMCAHANVDGNRLRTGQLDPDDKAALVQSSNELAGCALEIADPHGGLKVADIRRLGHQQKRKAGLALLVIDYLQLLDPDDRRAPRQEQVAAMARALKGLARELEIPVLCLAQLNRQVEAAKGSHRPQLGHLRESGAIEQDADVVLFIHREEVYSNEPDHKGKAVLITAKNRNGITRDYALLWDGPTCTFRTPAREWDQWPDDEPDAASTPRQGCLEFAP